MDSMEGDVETRDNIPPSSSQYHHLPTEIAPPLASGSSNTAPLSGDPSEQHDQCDSINSNDNYYSSDNNNDNNSNNDNNNSDDNNNNNDKSKDSDNSRDSDNNDDKNNNNNNDNNDDKNNIDALRRQQRQEGMNDKNKTLFGKSFFDDINNSIYGEDVNTIAQPFIGYIRRHEKKLSYEVGEYSILLRESKQLMSKIQKELDSLLRERSKNGSSSSSSSSNDDTYDRLGTLSSHIKDTVEWLFDVRRIYSKMDTYYGPTANPVGSISMIRMMAAYRKILEGVEEAADSSEQSGQLRKNIDKIIQSLQKRLMEFGGVQSTMRRMDGSLDFDLPIIDLVDQEKVLVLVEFIDALHNDWMKERKEMNDRNEQLQQTVDQLRRDMSRAEKEKDDMKARTAELEMKIDKMTHERALMEASSIVPSDLLNELMKVERTIDYSLKDLKKIMDSSSVENFNDSISTREIVDDTLSMSDTSKLIVDDYTVDSTWNDDEHTKTNSRPTTARVSSSALRERTLAESFMGSNVPFVKINLIPKIGGVWRKKQILDRRKKAMTSFVNRTAIATSMSTFIRSNQASLVLDTTSGAKQAQATHTNTEMDAVNLEASNSEPSVDLPHIKQIADWTTKIQKKITTLQKSAHRLCKISSMGSPSRQQVSTNFKTFDNDNNLLDLSTSLNEDNHLNILEGESSSRAMTNDDENSTYSASNVRLPNLARSPRR